MKFEFEKGLIWIPVKLEYEGNIKIIEQCILDTGSATTAIDIDLIEFNYQKPAYIRRLCGLGGGTQEVICQKVDKFWINEIEFNEIELEFGDIRSNLGINGFIGNDILSNLNVYIDFLRKEIQFKP